MVLQLRAQGLGEDEHPPLLSEYGKLSVTLWLGFVHRYELVTNPGWWTYAESCRIPAEGDRVCVRYGFDNKWYRGYIDKVKQVTACPSLV